MAVDVLVAGTGIFEAFVKVETGWARALEDLVAVKDCGLFGAGGGFENGAVAKEGFAKGLEADLFSSFRAFELVLVGVVPDIDEVGVKWVSFECFAVFFNFLWDGELSDLLLVPTGEFF